MNQHTPALHTTAKDLIARLVAFDTTSHKSNLDLMDFVRAYLSDFGIESHMTFNDDGGKANLFATIGPVERPGVALSGHTDCVPVEGQPWDSDPFRVIEVDGRLYGRGTCDMKGFVAMCLAMVPEMVSQPLATPIHLAFSYDEEVGCTGVRPMVARLGKDLPMPMAVLVGEPTMMDVVDAHKGGSDFRTEITGFESHSAMDLAGGNAIFAATRFVGELMRLREHYIARGDATGRFDPPYTSIHVGGIEGGTAGNIVPRHCAIRWEVRTVPGDTTADVDAAVTDFANREILPDMLAVSPDCAIVTRQMVDTPGLSPEPGSVAELLAKRLAGRNATQAVSYATEAGVFQLAGAPCVVCGPGDIAQAHRPNEFLAIDQVDACLGFLDRLIKACRNGL